MIGHSSFDPADSFCLDLAGDGGLEVWAGPLTAGRWAVALFNRALVTAPITGELVKTRDRGAARRSYLARFPYSHLVDV